MRLFTSRRLVATVAIVLGGPTTAAGATTEPPDETAGATTEAPDGTAGATGEFAGTIRLGAAVSETGRYEREGEDTRQGYDLWAEWVNEEYGGVQVGDERYGVEIVYYDDESDADTVANLTERLITEDEVDFLLGPYASDLTMGSSAIAEQHGVIMVEGNGASEAIFERGFQNVFGVLTPGGQYTQSALEALAAAGAETMVIAYEDTAFPTSVAEGAQLWAEEYGIEVLASESYPEGVTDVTAIMSGFRDLEPDVFVGGGHFNDGLLFMTAANELGFEPDAFVITVGPSNPEFAEELGELAEGVIGPTQWESVMTYEDEYFGTAADYAARYEERWGEPATYQAAESTAAALVLHIAIEQAGSLDADAVRQALQDMDITTFYGPINFDETGMNTAKPMGFIQIQDGEIATVGPADVAEAELIYPRGG